MVINSTDVETVVCDRYFFMDLTLFVMMQKSRRNNLPSSPFFISWQA